MLNLPFTAYLDSSLVVKYIHLSFLMVVVTVYSLLKLVPGSLLLS